jgi:hypothetical protein
VADLAGDDERLKRSTVTDFALRSLPGDRVLTRFKQDFEVTLLVGRELGAGPALICGDKCRIRERARTFDAGTNWTGMGWPNRNHTIDSGVAFCGSGNGHGSGRRRCLGEAKTGKAQESD